METENRCQNCQAPLAADAPKGLCPACLMKVAMASATAPGPEKPGFTPPGVEELAQKFPQLEIMELIGRGGMGAVYKARQKELDRLVALKILPPRTGNDAAFAERFTREAKALARLNHPGIVTIHNFGRADGLYFFIMEFVDGVNLRQLLASGRVSPREALAIVPQICDALQFAHDHGVVHRDIKPENILLDRRGRVKVADFGLVKIAGPAAAVSETEGQVVPRAENQPLPDLTDAGKIMGTPSYMAPEQIDAPAAVDHRADIYALGVVFYQMLTGQLPGRPLDPPSKKVLIDVRLDEVVLRALEGAPERRYQQVSEVKSAVETIAHTAVSDAVKAEIDQYCAAKPGGPPASKCAGRRSTFPVRGLVAGVAVALALAFLWRLAGPYPTTMYIESIQLISIAFQIGVAIYALWLCKKFGSTRAGWSLFGAFALMAALYLNKAFDNKVAEAAAIPFKHSVMRWVFGTNQVASIVGSNNTIVTFAAETNMVAPNAEETKAVANKAVVAKRAIGSKLDENLGVAVAEDVSTFNVPAELVYLFISALLLVGMNQVHSAFKNRPRPAGGAGEAGSRIK
jgi:hypothetical protein